MVFADLPLIYGLNALRVEDWIDGICVTCLESLVFLQAEEELVILTEIEVKASTEQVLVGEVTCVGVKTQSAGYGRTKPARLGKTVASCGIAGLWVARNSAVGSRSSVP